MKSRNIWPLGCAAKIIVLCATGILFSPVTSAGSSSAVHYQVARTVRLGAPDRWDYVVYDSPSHRVYVAHGDRVTVVDGRSGRIVGQINTIPGGTHGIAISHAAGLGYTVDGGAGMAVAFDLKTLKIVKRLKANADADAVTIDPTSGHVFVVDGDPGTLTVIDPKADRVVATVRIGSKLEYAVAGDNGKVYVNGEAKSAIFRIDTATDRVDATWPIPQCDSPHGLAIDISTHRLFSSCKNRRLVVVNADTGAVVAVAPIGPGTDAAAFDPVRKLIFSSNGLDGTLSVIREVDASTFVPAATVRTELSARTMSVDPQTGRLYLAAAEPLPGASTVQAFEAARAQGKKPYVQGSLELLFLDTAP
ncbi:MAG TPA: YncE family protein [Steroidobacteraceae bacterium]|nr:YncE family protein [Steroidobacteraceae bacterium]